MLHRKYFFMTQAVFKKITAFSKYILYVFVKSFAKQNLSKTNLSIDSRAFTRSKTISIFKNSLSSFLSASLFFFAFISLISSLSKTEKYVLFPFLVFLKKPLPFSHYLISQYVLEKSLVYRKV